MISTSDHPDTSEPVDAQHDGQTDSQIEAGPDDILRLERAIDRMATIGNTPVALWPAGRFTASLAPKQRDPHGVIACIIDDNPDARGKQFVGYPIWSVQDAITAGIRGLVICAPRPLQNVLWNKRRPFRDAGVQILTCPARFPGKPWDEGLCALWDHEQMQANGIDAAWTRVYPPADHELPSPYREYLRCKIQTGGGRVLEVGPGHGLVTAELIEHATDYTTVDFSARLLYELIEHRFGSHLDKLSIVHDETATLAGVADASVDVAISFDVFVHLHADMVHQYLAAFARVLVPGGRACLHLRTWDPAEIDVWEQHYRHERRGRWNGMGYNSIDTLGASAGHLGLQIERVGDDDGRSLLDGWTGYLVEVVKPG